jgi:hypothetical protein
VFHREGFNMTGHIWGYFLASLLWGSPALTAQPPKHADLILPPKKGAEVPKKEGALPLAQVRCNRYEVWQYYEVDRWGQFRPLVIYSPCGAYYRINGAPFPWPETHDLDFVRKRIE